ncbi:30S ribosomal protein S8 [Alphaproteobacteria bacterium endosymbiont of Tiliacea citrago]|uniref:30S ribosomal protein S8 n=1 Tax=Alphaproteobacteria bacterium endosymbiont of Tiliacea citrago TaxID=3077944 RepID=UPI00313AE1C3
MNWLTDGLTRIKNASASRKDFVDVRGTKLCLKVLEVLKEEGFILDFSMTESKKLKQCCSVSLKYFDGAALVDKMKFVSTPKNRIYKKCDDLKKYMHDFKFAVVSNDQGVMPVKKAIESNLGGEVLFWMGC